MRYSPLMAAVASCENAAWSPTWKVGPAGTNWLLAYPGTCRHSDESPARSPKACERASP